mmetsp:Transcript_14678/g.14294  ORF Transcript_14678/g.14294 Transcript_14678/m.14294 type:complete len:115 (-) Transcript_14678:23-367(-)
MSNSPRNLNQYIIQTEVEESFQWTKGHNSVETSGKGLQKNLQGSKKQSSATLNFKELYTFMKKDEGEGDQREGNDVNPHLDMPLGNMDKNLSTKIIAFMEKTNGVVSERPRWTN